jgi:tetratricopeptide (TPR) repeat protein
MRSHVVRKLTVLVLSTLTIGCAGPINLNTAMNYEQLAKQEMRAGNLELAEDYYGRALWNANMGEAPVSDISRLTYNLGRVMGQRCKHEEAEALLLEALRLEENSSGPETALTSMRLDAERIRNAHPGMHASFVKDSYAANCEQLT